MYMFNDVELYVGVSIEGCINVVVGIDMGIAMHSDLCSVVAIIEHALRD